jgi:hypothetical protein
MKTHSPAPWVVDHDTTIASVKTSDGKAVARCYQGDYDAALIAAAPDLLEALRYIATLDTSQDAPPVLCSAVGVAMLAIEQATLN